MDCGFSATWNRNPHLKRVEARARRPFVRGAETLADKPAQHFTNGYRAKAAVLLREGRQQSTGDRFRNVSRSVTASKQVADHGELANHLIGVSDTAHCIFQMLWAQT